LGRLLREDMENGVVAFRGKRTEREEECGRGRKRERVN
jgi:hypothetical protein